MLGLFKLIWTNSCHFQIHKPLYMFSFYSKTSLDMV